MEKSQILEVIVKHLKQNVDGLESVQIDPQASMADYDASSLDIVEVVSASMRELQLRIPRTRLAELNNIQDLVDLFHQAKNEEA